METQTERLLKAKVSELERTLRDVCAQRDRAFDSLDKFISAFWSAHYNHAFDAEDENAEHRCSCGYNLRDIFHGCPKFDKDGCKGWDCPMGFHHRQLYERADGATDMIQERKAERKPFALSRIPEFNPKCTYKVQSRWYAKMVICFFTEWRCGKKYTHEECKAFGDALIRMFRIGLAHYGINLPDDLFGDEGEKKYGEGTKDGDALFATLQDFTEKHGRKYIESKDIDLSGDKLIERMVDDEDFKMYWLVAQVATFIGEFRFGHDYPSADFGVYQDVISHLKWVCGHLIGCKFNDFDIIMAMNDESGNGLSTNLHEDF